MHDNVDISKELQETKLMFDNVLLTQGTGSGAGGSTDDALFAIADDILKKVRHFFQFSIIPKHIIVSLHFGSKIGIKNTISWK